MSINTSVVVLFNDYIHIVIDGLTSIMSVPAGGRYTDAIFDKAREIGFSQIFPECFKAT
jgi:hypothetical protein